MTKKIAVALCIILLTPFSIASDGVINIKSQYSVQETANRLETILKSKGMTVFTRINHAAGAQKVSMKLRDTELLIFGNPKVGTPLMQCQQLIALDLPQKALIWIDEKNRVWASYNDPKYLAKRHKLSGCDPVIEKVEMALLGMITKAAQDK